MFRSKTHRGDELVSRLRRENQVQADLIGMLGHEVKRPLTALLGYLEIIETEDNRLDDRAQWALSRAQGSGQRLVDLVDRVLMLASVEADRIVVRTDSVSLGPFLCSLMQELPDGESVRVEVGHPVPAVDFDPFHLTIVIANLISNAFKYGRAPVCIRVRGAPETDDFVDLIVSDDGDGLPAHSAEVLFERFVTEPGARTGRVPDSEPRGTGFGLYLCRSLVRANGGDLTYVPQEAGGHTAFAVRCRVATPLEPTDRRRREA